MQIRSELEYRQAQMRQQQIENQVGIEVRNAQYAVQQNRASVDSAKAALDLARQSLDAEQKKYQFGTSTTTLVLQYQSQLATAESTLVNATVAYEKSRIELDRATGNLLDHNGISMDDAARWPGHASAERALHRAAQGLAFCGAAAAPDGRSAATAVRDRNRNRRGPNCVGFISQFFTIPARFQKLYPAKMEWRKRRRSRYRYLAHPTSETLSCAFSVMPNPFRPASIFEEISHVFTPTERG